MATASNTLFATCLVLSACGGGSSAPPPTPGPDTAQRSQAASATAASSSNACAAILPFYWEIGDAGGRLAGASVNTAASSTTYDASSPLNIASASKWLYAAYVVERRVGALTAEDIRFLNFQSGYTSFIACSPGQTVDACLATSTNGDYTAANDGKFFYGGGHMQKHASLIGLGALGSAALASEIRVQLGTDIVLGYVQPQPAGGVRTTPDDYARFLRKLLGGTLKMGAALGSHPVCTNPLTCASAVSTPVPPTESWHYSVGHWVEDDPAVGDGAFSSAGAFGFYPWVDASRQHYGIVARQVSQLGAGFDSAFCGRLIRKAWLSGVAQ
jgi:hypothetical protein